MADQTTMNERDPVPIHGSLQRRFELERAFASSHSPIRQNTLAICNTKLNSDRPDISLVPLAVCNVFDRSCENKSARLGSS